MMDLMSIECLLVFADFSVVCFWSAMTNIIQDFPNEQSIPENSSNFSTAHYSTSNVSAVITSS